MIHLFKHERGRLKGKYDFAFVTNGRHKGSSDGQGFENRADAVESLISVAKDFSSTMFTYQDNVQPVAFKVDVYLVSKTIDKRGYTVNVGKPNKRLNRYMPPTKLKKIDTPIKID
jgi:hypothetical protein